MRTSVVVAVALLAALYAMNTEAAPAKKRSLHGYQKKFNARQLIHISKKGAHKRQDTYDNAPQFTETTDDTGNPVCACLTDDQWKCLFGCAFNYGEEGFSYCSSNCFTSDEQQAETEIDGAVENEEYDSDEDESSGAQSGSTESTEEQNGSGETTEESGVTEAQTTEAPAETSTAAAARRRAESKRNKFHF